MSSRVRVYIASSLDGFIAGPDDDLSWLDEPSPEDSPAPSPGALGFHDFMAQIGCMLMGRRSYEVVAGFGGQWPYGDVPVLIATHRPLEPVVSTVRAVTGDIEALLAEAKEIAGDKDVYIDGGNLIRQAVEADAVDEYVITFAPVVLGSGIPLFAGIDGRRSLEIVSHHDYGGGMLQVKARPRR